MFELFIVQIIVLRLNYTVNHCFIIFISKLKGKLKEKTINTSVLCFSACLVISVL